MFNKLISRLTGGPPLADRLSDNQLIAVFQRLASMDPVADLTRIRSGERSLIGSCAEWLSKGGAQSNEQFLRRTYEGLLGREPDEKGFSDYVGGLTSGSIGRAEVIDSFLRSQEFRERMGMTTTASDSPAMRPGGLRAYASDCLQRMLYPHRFLPPLSMRQRVGERFWDFSGYHFQTTGWHFTEKLSRDAGLGRGGRVLDLGSGCGRIAIPLIEVISPPGLYHGLEAVKGMVKWCQRKITTRFPHFQFLHCDVRNAVYNPRGRENPETFQFPFDPNTFDLTSATSIFTHLLPNAAINYIRECGRVLRNGGTLFATFFLRESGTRSADGELDFAYPVEDTACSAHPHLPESAVAYRTDWLLDAFRRSGLELVPPVRWGGWSGKTPAYSGQDVLIFRKQ